jgi:hypothetical protein
MDGFLALCCSLADLFWIVWFILVWRVSPWRLEGWRWSIVIIMVLKVSRACHRTLVLLLSCEPCGVGHASEE